MSSSLNQEVGDIVCAVVSTSATPPVIVTSSGVNAQTATPAGVVRNGKGDFTVNFPLNPCDILSRNSQITATNSASIPQVNGGSDTSCGVLMFDAAGAAVDADFSLIITRTKTP